MILQKKILVVDDDLLIRKLLIDALSCPEYQVIEASDGSTALDAFGKFQPDLVILDLFMPAMDGFQVCQNIRSTTTTPHIPVIVLTALEDADSIQRAFELDVADFLFKPLRVELIKHRVKTILNKAQTAQASPISPHEGTAIIENIPDPIIIYNTQMEVVWVNEGARRYFDRSEDQIIGLSCSTLCQMNACKQNLVCINQRCIKEGKVLTGMSHHRDGTIWGLRVFPLRNDLSGFDKILCLAHDITEKVKLQADAAYANQLVHIGELAAGIAHEINNPLNGIINYSQVMLNQLTPDNPLHELASKINLEGERVARIANSLLSFSWRGRQRGMSFENLCDVISDVLVIAQPRLQVDGIHVVCNVPPSLQEVEMNRQAIQQVLLNLFDNACYALNERHGERDDAKILELTSRRAEVNGKDYIELAVKDNGSGIPARQIGLLKMPFFTTRPEGAGSGIGLSIAHKIIKEHHGELLIDSVEGEATTIRLLFPCPVGATRGTGK